MTLYWVSVLLTSIAVYAVGQEKLDLTLLAKKLQNNNIQYTCVAGENVRDIAIAFLTFENDNLPVSRFKYKENDFTNNEFSCDFENMSECPKWQNIQTQNSINSQLKMIEIMDRRWESKSKTNQLQNYIHFLKEFQSYRGDKSKNVNHIPITKTNDGFKIGISVRIKNKDKDAEVSILLCKTTINGTECYWLQINETDMMLNKCHQVNTKKIKQEDSECTNIKEEKNSIKLDMWQHFVIKLTKNEFVCSNKNQHISHNISESESDELRDMYLFINKNEGIMKIHNYRFMSLSTELTDGNWHSIGPELRPIDGVLCVTLYAAICKTCTLEFRFANYKIASMDNITNNEDWNYYKFVLNTTNSQQFQVKTNKNNGGFWYIDDIRQCHPKEIRMIEINATTSSKMSCVALNKEKISCETDAKKDFKGCDDVTKIGTNCDIPCSSIFGDEVKYCDQHKICVKKTSSCAAGFFGDFCTLDCQNGTYGYDCREKCMPCIDYCPKNNGKCPDERQCRTYRQLGCETLLINYHKDPVLVNSTLTTITFQIKLNYSDNKDMIDIDNIEVEVLYKLQKGKDSSDWISLRNKYKDENFVTLDRLKPETLYRVKLVLHYKEENTSSFENYEDFFTMCENVNINNYTNLSINTTKTTEIHLSWTAICNAFTTIKIEPIDKSPCHEKVPDIENVNIVEEQRRIKDLIPNTHYKLTFGDEEKTFTTEAVPVLKSPPKIINSTLTTLTVQFEHSDVIKGNEVNKYEIEYKMTKSEKWDNKTTKINLITSTNTYTLKNLEKETNYSVRVIFNGEKLKDKCIKETIAETSCMKDLSKYNLVNNLNTKEYTNKVDITWTAICRNEFNIETICHNNWCNTKQKTYGPINSIDEFNTISDLTPYTNYSLIFKDANQKEERRNFATKPTAAPKVQDLQIWSIDRNSVFVRFKDPYPPNGEFEKYETKCSNNNPTKIENVPCKIWSEYKCLEITYYSIASCNKISVAVKNKNVNENLNFMGKSVDINKKSDAPHILNANLTNICFQHPNFIKGKLKSFVVQIQLNDTLLQDDIFKQEPLYKNVSAIENNYCQQLNIAQPSSTFKVSVQVLSNTEKEESGSASEIFLTTEPIQPQLENNITSLERTNNTQKIGIPQVTNSTKTKSSTIYIIACDPSAKHPWQENLTEIKEKIKKWSNCTTNSFWVVSAFNDLIKEYTINDLRPDINYTITVLVVNEYKGKYSIVKRSLITTAPELHSLNWAIYLLFLLFLIVPIIGFFMYRRMRKFNKNTLQRMELQDRSVNRTSATSNLFRSLPKLPIFKKSDISEPLLESKDNEEYSKLVKVSHLSQYVKESIENGTLAEQHKVFPKGPIHPWDYGTRNENKFKNRYNNITAYDHSRVILHKLNNDQFSDFINASYIDGYQQPRAYIATQGPKPHTVGDFWRMIWQEDVTCIVMLANLVENKKQKCHQYWPEQGSTDDYHDIYVTATSTDISADFVYRFFDVNYKGETRKIQQLHFTSWPDHGVPLYPQSLVPFLRRILTVSTIKPIVVHCSAGVGRTGTIILADICLRMAAKEHQVDVFTYMHDIREQRVNLVDNYDQYLLVHMVLLECVLAPETSLPCNNLREAIEDIINQKGLEKQMKYLKDTAWQNKVLQNPIEIDETNMIKNRFADIVPTQRQIFISRFPYDDENSDYINAVPVDGYGFKDRFIVTQNPMTNTVQDFWRMIAEEEVRVIVSLNQIRINDHNDCIFWPPNINGQSTPLPYITLTCESIKDVHAYDIYNIQLQNTREGNEYQIRLIQYKSWDRDQILPGNSEDFIKLLEEAQSLSRQDAPVVVTCYDGAKASGLFVALSFVIEKMKLEQICDVCQAVRAVRSNRDQFVTDIQQFEFLYNSALNYLVSFDDYSNFEVLRK